MQQAAFALAEGRVIFTQDRDFLRLHAAGTPHAGLAYCRQNARTIAEIIRGLTLLWETMEPTQLRDWLVYL